MRTPKTIGFYGFSGSGKTTLIEALCRDLTASGVRLAVIKQSDKAIRLDKPGKDTFRFQDAGAEIVALASKSETDIMINSSLEIHQIIHMVTSLHQIDLVIIESANDPELAKIRIGEIEERNNTIMTYDDDYQELLKFVLNY